MSTTPSSRKISTNEADRIALCQEKIGYTFTDEQLLRAALTHASSADRRLESNERLEFLGDAILGKVVCELLFRMFPKAHEGELTKIKSDVVSRKSCAEISRKLGLQDCLTLGRGMTTRALPQSLVADVFEAIVAAIYLDGGDEPATEFVTELLQPRIERASRRLSPNHKSELQQLSQKEFGTTPVYVVLDEQGPDHSKSFLVTAEIDGVRHPAAWGAKKKDAEQLAAANALSAILKSDATLSDDLDADDLMDDVGDEIVDQEMVDQEIDETTCETQEQNSTD